MGRAAAWGCATVVLLAVVGLGGLRVLVGAAQRAQCGAPVAPRWC